MDDATQEQKIRSLKIRIMQVEKEIAAKMHGSHLNAFLSVGHASQIAKASERDRKRLEGKLEELKKQLYELDPRAIPPPEKVEAKPAPVEKPPTKPKKAAAPAKPKTAATKPTAKKKAAATKAAAATKTTKKPAKKSK